MATIFLLSVLALGGSVVGASETGSTAGQERLPQTLTDDPLLNSRFVLFGSNQLRRKTLRWAKLRGNTDMVAPMLYALRYLHPDQRMDVVSALQKLTKRRYGDDWFRWMQWQQSNPEVVPFEGFDIFLTGLFSSLDPRFKDFIYPGVSHDIRLEEVVWGGVVAKDGIPPLTNPALIDADDADYLTDDELVFGISINGDARAYPYRIMDWHEMLNDIVGDQPVSLAYCTLCGSGILYDTKNPDGGHITFGSSGLLYRSNKLMFDTATNSLWNQFTGRPVIGRLAGGNQQLRTLPLVTTTWKKWRGEHPDTKVLDLNTGFTRDYSPGAPYGKYFRSGKLMFPAATDNKELGQKDVVFGLRLAGADRHANKSWPLKLFKRGAVLNDKVGALGVVLVGDAASKTVRAYRRNGIVFSKGSTSDELRRISGDGVEWAVAEDALVSDDGRKLTRLPGHLSYWFAWHNYLGVDSLAD